MELPEGWPTQEMVAAAFVMLYRSEDSSPSLSDVRGALEAALAVAPTPPAPDMREWIHKLIAAVHFADKAIEERGEGSSKDWVLDHFIPELTKYGLGICLLQNAPTPKNDETVGDILKHFAMEFEPGTGTLKRYLAQYPEHTIALVDLSRELSREVENMSTAPTPTARNSKSGSWKPVQEAINNYVNDYEYDDGDSHHCPTAVESLLIHDALSGLLTDEKFAEEFTKWLEQEAPSISIFQVSIAFGKYAAGHRPGSELWTSEDQQALDAVMSGKTTT